jgi:Anti-sigma-K factor rskA/Putative zinc-finger
VERMISHEEAQELLGAYALDAVDADEAALVEYHLDRCPRCRDELRNHREVVGLLAYAGHEAPAGLWDRVVEGIQEAGSSAPAPALRTVAARPGTRVVPLRSRRVLAVVAAAAVVAIALLGVQVTRLQHRTNQLSSRVASVTTNPQPTMAAVRQALAEPGAKRADLRSPAGGHEQLDAVILPSGDGYLYSPTLAPLPSSETYQLWGVVGRQQISYGLMGSDPAAVMAFRAANGLQALAVTAEEAGGVVTTTHSPVVVGAVT